MPATGNTLINVLVEATGEVNPLGVPSHCKLGGIRGVASAAGTLRLYDSREGEAATGRLIAEIPFALGTVDFFPCGVFLFGFGCYAVLDDSLAGAFAFHFV